MDPSYTCAYKKRKKSKKNKWFNDGYIDNKVIVDRSGVYKVGNG
jgi:hypothetical protein